MSDSEWIRKATWTAADRANFFARLQRARPHSRAQYLRIQAAHLEEAGHYDHMIFPVRLFLYAAAKAMIYARTGRSADSRIFARRALEESRRQTSGLRYHPKLGLVGGLTGP